MSFIKIALLDGGGDNRWVKFFFYQMVTIWVPSMYNCVALSLYQFHIVPFHVVPTDL